MQIYGMDVYYLPRTTRDAGGVDFLFGDDVLKQFISAFPIEMYLENVTGMEGEGDFISKFGLEIRDEATLLVSRRRFAATVGNRLRPQEGDLIYIPLIRNFFELTFVEHENDQAMFYTLGRGRGGNVYVYALKMKQFVFSEEYILTGITEIDDQAYQLYKRTKLMLNSGSGSYLPREIVYQGNSLANCTAKAEVFSYLPNTQLNVIRMIGNFVPSANVIGNTTGAKYSLAAVNDNTQVDKDVYDDIHDNINIEEESDGIVDFTEKNPFGEA